MIRARVIAGLDRVRQQGRRLGRPMVSAKVKESIRRQVGTEYGVLKVAKLVGVGSGTVQRINREMEIARSHSADWLGERGANDVAAARLTGFAGAGANVTAS